MPAWRREDPSWEAIFSWCLLEEEESLFFESSRLPCPSGCCTQSAKLDSVDYMFKKQNKRGKERKDLKLERRCVRGTRGEWRTDMIQIHCLRIWNFQKIKRATGFINSNVSSWVGEAQEGPPLPEGQLTDFFSGVTTTPVNNFLPVLIQATLIKLSGSHTNPWKQKGTFPEKVSYGERKGWDRIVWGGNN